MKTLWVLFVAYIIPFFPFCPWIGRIEEADCILVQAFGRNSIKDNNLGWFLDEVFEESEDTLPDIFKTLQTTGFDPGAANYALADEAHRLSEQLNIPVLAQWEVMYALWKNHPIWFVANGRAEFCLWPRKEEYFSTWEVTQRSKQVMDAHKYKNPLELAHPAMLARGAAIVLKCIGTVIVEPSHTWKFWEHPLWVWDRASIQPWTRSFVFGSLNPFNWWLVRESLARYIHHPLKGRVSFRKR